jgi:pseudouridine synthase
MRLNKFLAEHTDLSRRSADTAIANGRIRVNGKPATLGLPVGETDTIELDGQAITSNSPKIVTILLHKPAGYVCSKNGQGSKTVYDLLPKAYEGLNIAGRLDKDSSGLVVMTNDGSLLNELTHPSNNKEKAYIVSIDKTLWPEDQKKLLSGTDIGDERPSKFKRMKKQSDKTYEIVLGEGRNRQIRRAFESLGYTVTKLHREQLGRFRLGKLKEKEKIIL